MSILISGSAGIDMGNLPVSNASQVEVQDNQVSPFGGFKNYIINGNFYIWQRGTSQTTTAFGSDDRWGNFNVNSTKVHSRVECTDTERALFNAQYFSRTVSTYVVGTSSFVMKSQTIENMTILAGKKVTVSFWAKANSNKVMNVKVTDLYGSGGTPTVSGTNTTNLGNVNLTSSWQKYSLTATLPSLVGKTLGTDGNHCFRLDFGFTFSPDRNEVVNFGMTAGQSGTFDIAQVQLEEGSIATPFENRPYGLELSLCQRYAWYSNEPILGTINVYPSGAQQVNTIIKYPVMMRVVPTINVTSNTAVNQYAGNTKNQVSVLQTLGNGGAPTITSISADAEL